MTAATTATPGRRERKKQETRQGLQAAALRLVVENGIDRVTVEDIAEAADVSTRTFFNYFPTKEEALVGVDPARGERLLAVLASRPVGEPPLDTLRAVCLDIAGELTHRRREELARVAVIRRHPALLAASVSSWHQDERALVDALAARLGLDADRDVYPSLVVAAAFAAVRAALLRWRAGGTAPPLPDLVGSAFDALAAGLPAPPTRTTTAGRSGRPRRTGTKEHRS